MFEGKNVISWIILTSSDSLFFLIKQMPGNPQAKRRRTTTHKQWQPFGYDAIHLYKLLIKFPDLEFKQLLKSHQDCIGETRYKQINLAENFRKSKKRLKDYYQGLCKLQKQPSFLFLFFVLTFYSFIFMQS